MIVRGKRRNIELVEERSIHLTSIAMPLHGTQLQRHKHTFVVIYKVTFGGLAEFQLAFV
jgi:hypothetical protein